MAAIIETLHMRAKSSQIRLEEDFEAVEPEWKPGKKRERSNQFHNRTVSFARDLPTHSRQRSTHHETIQEIAHQRQKSSIRSNSFYEDNFEDATNYLQYEDLNYIPEDLTFGLRRIFPEDFDTAKHERFPTAIGYFDDGMNEVPEHFFERKRVLTLPGMCFSYDRSDSEWDRRSKARIMRVIGSFCFTPVDLVSLAVAYPFFKRRIMDSYFDDAVIDEAEDLIIAFKDGLAWGFPGNIPLIEISGNLLNAVDHDGNPVRLSRNKVCNAFAALTMTGGVLTWGSKYHGGDSSAVHNDIKGGVYQLFATAYAFAALKKNFHVVCWGLPGYGGDCSDVEDLLKQDGVVTIKSTHGAFAALTRKNACVVWGDPEFGGCAGRYAGEIERGVSRVYASASAFAIVKTNGSIIVLGQQNLNGCEDDRNARIIQDLKNVHTTTSGFVAMMRNGRTWHFQEESHLN